MKDGSVVSDFCQRIGADLSKVMPQDSNESLSATTVALLFFWNRECLVTPSSMPESKARRATIRLVSKQFPGRFRFRASLLRENIDEDDVRWMEEVSGFSLMPPKTAEDGDGIESEADLEVLRQGAAEKLTRVCAARDIDVPAGASTSAMLTALYQSFRRRSQ